MKQFRLVCRFLLVFAMFCAVARAAPLNRFPDQIALPNGWLPEGIVTGRGPVIYSGSRANGAIYAADLRTGEGAVLVPGQMGRVAVGLDFDERTNYIYVAGGGTGRASVYDAATGREVGSWMLASTTQTFINDVIVTEDAAYFTDSQQPVIYKLPLGRGGSLPSAPQTIPLTGDYQHVSGSLNLNGIEATANGKTLIAVHSTLGVLYAIDPATGVAQTIDLGGASVVNGDGLLLRGHTLYVVQNRLNQIAVVDLSVRKREGEVTELITSGKLDVPTTIAAHGHRLYVVNARFTTPATPQTTYNIVQLPR
jgi:DNA-binding beta-propeller fold protein YncE